MGCNGPAYFVIQSVISSSPMKKITLLSVAFMAFSCRTSSVNSTAIVNDSSAQEVAQNEVKTEKPKPEIMTDVPVTRYGDAILNGGKCLVKRL